ncbi:MAG TPA: hypothetical protein VFM18_10260 [Methanosarcina sp.]|nr:hypothetical protein [Methanosarcina sp.]
MYTLENSYLQIPGIRQVKDEEGKLKDEEFDITVRRVKRKDLAKFTEKYEEVLRRLFLVDGQIGSFLKDDKNYTLLKQVCELVPVDEEDGKLHLEWIEEDYTLLTLLFFTLSYDAEKQEFSEEEKMRKPLLAKFNFVEYDSLVGKLSTETMIQRMKASKPMVEELEQLKIEMGV